MSFYIQLNQCCLHPKVSLCIVKGTFWYTTENPGTKPLLHSSKELT